MSTPRANDTETHQPYADPTALHKFVGWMWTKYSRKLLLKIGVISAPVINAIVQWTGNTPQASQAIGIGLSALLLGALDFVVSYLGKRMGFTNLESLQKLSEQQEPIRDQPAIPFTSDSGKSFKHSAFSGDWPWQKLVGQEPLTDDESAWLASKQETKVLKEAPAAPAIAGYSVEVGGEQHDFIDKLAAIKFRDSARAEGKTANLLP